MTNGPGQAFGDTKNLEMLLIGHAFSTSWPLLTRRLGRDRHGDRGFVPGRRATAKLNYSPGPARRIREAGTVTVRQPE